MRRSYHPFRSLEALEPRVVLSAFYDLSLVSATSQQTTGGDTIDSIDAFVSINDSAKVAYVAGVSGPGGNGTTVIVDDAISAPLRISFENPEANRAFAFPQINNAGLVAVRDRFTGTNPNPSFIRTWDAANPGTHNVVTASNDGVFDSVTLPTINNGGAVAFIGFTGGVADAGVYVNPFATRGEDLFVTDVTGSGGLRPMLSDDEQIVVRKGTDADAVILLLDAADGSAVSIASTASGHWRTLGNSPGISDDGQVIVFYGDLTPSGADTFNARQRDVVPVPLTPGRGIFASLVIAGTRRIIRVAGEAGSGFVDPGERRPIGTTDDVGPDFNFDYAADWQIGLNGFSASSRVGVSSLLPFDDPAAGSRGTIVFHANDVIGTTGPAIYASRINLFKNGGDEFVSVGVEAPIQVIRAGENIANLGVVADFVLYDPVNRGGQIAVWASTATSQGVLLATRNLLNDLVPNRNRQRFDPDSPLVEYIVAGLHARQNNRAPINQIVLHAVADDEDGGLRTLTQGRVPGIHYLVGREGRITQIIREEDVANHAPESNANTIGIELVDDTRYLGPNNPDPTTGHLGDANWATDIQLKKAALLVRDIALRYGIHDDSETKVIHNLVGANAGYVEQGWEDAVPLQTGTAAQPDGVGPAHAGVLRHGQVFDRTGGRTDPQNFDLYAFMTRVNQGIGLTLNSPANLLVTDPIGRRVGVDPATGQTVNEIPGASFSGAGVEPQSLTIPGGIDGQYQVKVVGTGEGDFHLDVFAGSAAGELMRTQVADQITPGVTIAYTLNHTTQLGQRPNFTSIANLPPVAFDDQFTSRGGGGVLMPVLTNDSDPEGLLDVSSIMVIQPPSNGTAAVDPGTGMITYTPAPGFVGEDSFEYEVRDTAGLASRAAVTVRVLRETQAPVAGDDGVATQFDTPVVVDVLANDSDADGTIEPTSVEIDHDGDAENGKVQIDPVTGQITYTPDPDFFGTDTFMYAALDNDLARSNLATVTVTVAAPAGPEIAVTLGGAPIVDGDSTPETVDGTDFGAAGQNVSAPVRTFTVRNIGTQALTLGPVSVPTGFALVEPLVASLEPGGSDTFSIQLITSALGTFGGAVTFSTNDASENPFDFTIAGEVATLPGSLDLTFGGGDGWMVSRLVVSEVAESMLILADGKYLVGGFSGHVSHGFTLARYLPNGNIDLTFGGGDGFVTTEFSSGAGRSVLLLPDGKILFVGEFVTRFDFKPGIGVVRYNADGTLDRSFGGEDLGVVTRFHGLIESIEEAVLQPDGKIVVVGSNDSRGNRDFAVARLNANGTVDTTFGGGDGLATTDFGANDNDPARAVVVQRDGKIVVVGQANGKDFGVARFNADGSLDATFGGGDGLVVTDTGGGADVANDVLIQPDGRIVVVGGGGLLDGFIRKAIAIARYNTDGSPDTSFGGGDGIVVNNFPEGDSDEADGVVLQPDGKLIVVGHMTSGHLLARYNADGNLDSGFGGGGRNVIQVLGPSVSTNAVALAPDGKIVIAGGGGYHVSNVSGFTLTRYHGDPPALPTVSVSATDAEGAETGANDVRFTVTRSGPTDQPLTVLFQLQNDGVAGQAKLDSDFRMAPGATQVTIPAGAVSADMTFVPLLDANLESDELITLEILHSPTYAIGLPFIADGIIRGECDEIVLNGDLDSTFGGGDGLAIADFDIGSNGSIAMAIAPDGKLFAAARVSGNFGTVHVLARFRTNGIPDPSFGKAGLVVTPLSDRGGARTRIAVQSDGKVIVAGVIDSTSLNFAMVRYHPNGTLDTSFGGGDGVVETDFAGGGPTPHDYLTNILVQPDGKILLAGSASGDVYSMALARYNADGSLDNTFGDDGLVTTYVGTHLQIHALELQSDGKIVAAASVDLDSFSRGETDFAVLRYNLDGSLDTTFGGGTGYFTESIANTDRARDVAVQPDGKIMVVGEAITIRAIGGNTVDGFLVRYNADGSRDTSFGAGDGLVVETGASASQANAGYAVELQSDGKIILVGIEDNALAVARYDANGMRDATFGGGDGLVTLPRDVGGGFGAVLEAALQPDGKLVVGRTSGSGFPLFRFTGDCIVPQPLVAGVKFQDLDGNGNREAGEASLAGWEIRAYADLDVNGQLDATELAAGIRASTVTGESGEYELSFPAGHYVIVEVAQPGWTQSFPVGSVNEVDPTLDEFGYAVSLNFGQTSAARDFGSSSSTSTNRPPALEPIADRTVEVGQTVAFSAAAADPDGDNLAFGLAAGAPTGATINSATGEFSWTPQETHASQSFSITFRVTDDGQPALSDVETFTITVAAEGNLPPALDPIADRIGEVGLTVSFTATATDPDGDELTFSLDAGAPAGATINAQTGEFSFTPTAGQAGQVFSITVRVVDDANPTLSDTETFSITVQPQVEPHFTLSPINGPDVGVPGQLRTYSLTFTDPNSIENYTATIDWADGVVDSGFMSTQTSGGVTTGVISFWHTYTTIGDRTVRLTLRDGQGNQLTTDHLITVQLVTFQPDPLNTSRRALVAGGYEGVDEQISFNPDGPGVNVMYRDYNHGRFLFDGSVIAFGQSGNDSIRVHPSVTNTSMLFGQAGDDLLVAGAGASVLLGGAGNDTLHGSALRDLLFGGLGADLLHGIAPDRAGAMDEGDLIASDVTAWEYDPNLLASIFDRWSLAGSYADRLTSLRYLQSPALNKTTVFDDFAADRLTGGTGLDWFVFFSTDVVLDPEASEEGLGVRL